MFCGGSLLYHNEGFKTFIAKISEDTKLIPPDGIYAIRVEIEGESSKGMMLNNYHGTFDHPNLEQAVEIHLFELTENFCDKSGKIFVHKEISRNIQIKNTDKLKNQLMQIKSGIEDLIY
jgi:riboflavin kinase/FMN adenylyltransferase